MPTSMLNCRKVLSTDPLLQDQRTCFLDVRGERTFRTSGEKLLIDRHCDTSTYLEGHLPKAACVHWPTELLLWKTSFVAGFPEISKIKHLLHRAGVTSADTPLVVYDDGSHLLAARAAISIGNAGFANVGLLWGGLPAWLEQGYPMSTEVPDYLPRAKYQGELNTAGTYEIHLCEVRQLIESGKSPLIDCRTAAEFRGEISTTDRKGTVTDALHFEGEHTTKAIAEAVGAGQPIVFFSNEGLDASLVALDTLWQYPKAQIRIWSGGWHEWSAEQHGE